MKLTSLIFIALCTLFMACSGSAGGRTEVFWENGKLKFEVEEDEFGNWQGEARWYFEAGELERSAHYVDGELHGPFIQYALPGHPQQEGSYEMGREIGHWKYYHYMPSESGPVVQREGSFQVYDYEGERLTRKEGIWTYFDSEGHKIREGSYKEDMEDGPWKEWWPNGNLKSAGEYVFEYVEYKEGADPFLTNRKTGNWKYYSQDGELEREENHVTAEPN